MAILITAVALMMAATSMMLSAGRPAMQDRSVWLETFISMRFVRILVRFVDI